MKKNNIISPVVKWVGGKRQLLSTLTPLLPNKINTYCEPFLGGGAMLFSLQPKKAILNDINSDLINMYCIIRDNVDELILTLENYKNESDFFYKVRDWDRDREKYIKLSDVEKAARLIYLNKTCYNGLFRVNNAGEFNTPFGNYKNPNIVNSTVLKAVSIYLNNEKIQISNNNYIEIISELKKGSFVYLDPPYDPISQTASFTGYSQGGFTRINQEELKNCCDDLTRKGVKFMLSNSSTEFIRNLYNEYNITIVQAKRTINSDATKRGNVDEVVIRNYE